MITSAVYNSISTTRWLLALFLAGVMLASFMFVTSVAQGALVDEVDIQQRILGSNQIFPEDNLSFEVRLPLEDGDELEATTMKVEAVGPQLLQFDVPLEPGNVNIPRHGATVRGAITHEGTINWTGDAWEADGDA